MSRPSSQPVDQRAFNRQLRRAERHLSEVSPALAEWIAAHGPCGLEIAWQRDVYESLVRAVAYQQLNGRAAETILGRFRAGFRGEGFPTPAQVARATHEKLRAMGFSTAKSLAIQGIAQAARRGEIPSRDEAHAMGDDALVERLIALRGVGKWTVEMLLIFTLGRLDTMPLDDFGVQNGLRRLLGLSSLPKKKEVAKLTEAWSPYRSVGAWYLWRRAELIETKVKK